MDASIYDTREGIASQLGSYEDLYAVLMERRKACLEREERLTSFVIMGRFSSDMFGQLSRLTRETFTDAHRAAMPQVMTQDEFDTHIATLNLPEFSSIQDGLDGDSTGQPYPPGMCCTSFGLPWDFADCHDYDDRFNFSAEHVFDDSFVGITLREAQNRLNDTFKNLTIHEFRTAVRNDKWIDSTPGAMVGLQIGWRDEEHEDTPISMDYVIRTGDVVSLNTIRYWHGECFKQLLAQETAEEARDAIDSFVKIFETSGFTEVAVEKIPFPQHMRDWFEEDSEGEGEDFMDQIDTELTYLQVSTTQGSLGIFIAAYPALDLTETGIELTDLYPELADMPDDMPKIIGFDGEPAVMLKLWQLMVNKQAKDDAD